MSRLGSAAVLAAILLAPPQLLHAMATASARNQVPCGDYRKIAEHLASSYHELPIGAGVSDSGQGNLEIFVAPDGKTWTAVGRMPGGVGCIFDSGRDWVAAPPRRDGKDS